MSFSSGHAPFIYQGRNWGKDIPEENGLCSNLGGKQKTDSSLPAPWPQALVFRDARLRLELAQHRLVGTLGQGQRHCSVYEKTLESFP